MTFTPAEMLHELELVYAERSSQLRLIDAKKNWPFEERQERSKRLRVLKAARDYMRERAAG